MSDDNLLRNAITEAEGSGEDLSTHNQSNLCFIPSELATGVTSLKHSPKRVFNAPSRDTGEVDESWQQRARRTRIMSSGSQYFCCSMSSVIPGFTNSFLNEQSQPPCTKTRIPPKRIVLLPGVGCGYSSLCWVWWILGLEVGLHLFGGEWSVCRGRASGSCGEECIPCIRFYASQDGGRVWLNVIEKRGPGPRLVHPTPCHLITGAEFVEHRGLKAGAVMDLET